MKLYGASPPNIVSSILPEARPQLEFVCVSFITIGDASVIVTVKLVEQFLASKTVKLYTPAASPVRSFVVALKPFGPLQL
ncbi:hypothetical protein D3C78_1075280 [compost metagenome]